jgi:hypothetical protein
MVHVAKHMPPDAAPNFQQAVARFRDFLRTNNYSDDIIWVTADDVLLTGKRLAYIRIPFPADNLQKVGRTYDEGVAQGRGLLMSTLCRMYGSTCCYLWFPRAAGEVPQGVWPADGGLKLSARASVSTPICRPIRNRILWGFLKRWHYKRQDLKAFLLQ